MKFDKFGKAYHMDVGSSDALREVLELDDSFWAAVSAPTAAFRCDPAFLRFVDSDGNGRMRSDEVRAALKWLLETLCDVSGVGRGSDGIPLAAVSKDSASGPGLLVTAAYVNEQAGRPDATDVRLSDVRAAMSELRAKPLNGDGVIVPAAAGDDAALREWIEAVVSATGGADDLSGVKGATAAQVAEFDAAVKAFLAWKARGAADNPETMPLGAGTDAAWNLFQRHRDAVDRFFFLADFQRYDPAGAEKFLLPDAAGATAAAALEAAPLARPLPDGALPLDGPNVNPLRRDVVSALRTGLFAVVLGREAPESVSEADWKKVKEVLAGHGAWLDSKAGAIAEKFPAGKLAEWENSPFAGRVAELVEKDAAVAKRVAAFSDLEKLLLYSRDLPRFLANYVSLSEFYKPGEISLFERGRLLLDGRWFNLSVEVPDEAAHAAVAKNGGLFTMYCKVEPSPGAPSFTVVVPATAGTRGNIAVGKRGVFFDLHGHEYDATVTSVIEAPISLREAICAPFANIAKAVMAKIEGMSAAAQEKIEKAGTEAADAAAEGKVPAAPPPAPAAQGGGAAGAVGMFAGVSVAVAALGSAFAFIAKSVSGMSWTARLLTLAALLVVVFGPIVLAGVLKLMRQDMGPILEGCGWAVNKSMRLTRALRRQFTEVRPYPEEAEGTPAKRRAAAAGIAAAVLVVALFVWRCSSCIRFGAEMAREADASAALSAAPADSEPVPAAPADAAATASAD